MAERLEAAGKGASVLQETGTKESLGQTIPQNGKLAPLERWPEPWVAQCEEFLKALDFHRFQQEESPAPTKPGPWDDAKAFLASFERVAEACHWPREEWAARLLPALSGKAERAFSRLDARDREDYGKVKAAIFQEEANGMEALRQHFRQFRYQGLEDPRRIYGQLRERCLLWLKPERHSKEQILELLILEQFRAILPQEIKSWEADAGSPQMLVEGCRHHPKEAKTWEWQVPLDEVSRSSPGMAETAESQAYEEAEEKVNKELGLLADRIMTPHHPNPVVPPEIQDMAEAGLTEGNVPLNGSLGSAEWSTSNAMQGTMHWEVMQGNLEDVSRLGGFVIPKPEAVPQMEHGEIVLHRDSENREAFPGSIPDEGEPLKIKEEDYQPTEREPKERFIVPLEISQGEASLVAEIHKHSDHGDMAPKKASEGGKRKKVKILLEVKKEIIRKHEEGMRLIDLAREYGRNISTIGTILKMKEKITRRDAAKGVSRVSKQRPPILEEVEKLLLLWIEEKQRAGDTVTEVAICAKAKALHADLLAQQPGTSADAEGFKASRGWFERFKARSGFHGVARHGEATSSNVAAAEDFAAVFLEAVVSEGYLPQQVFNCDETGLFWKRMPKRTFLAQEETSLPGHEPMKDRLTLLLCANASGDLKIKPLLVYHSENPWAFKKHQVKKEQLGVLWRSSPKAWVTRLLFAEWVNLVFGPAVKQYLVDNHLPLKAVLLMDNAPAHPPGLEEDLLEDFNFIKVMFLPPNTTPLLQPMNQQVISSFKQLYTRELFRRCFEMTDGSSLALHEFWRDHFDLVSCLQMITLAWAGVSQRNLNAAWRNLWPDCVVTMDSDASAPAPESIVLEEIVSLGRTMGLEVTEGDVCELVEEHDRELTTEDLVELQKEAMEERISFEEEEMTEGHLSSRELKEACQMWEDLQIFVQQHHPDKALAQRLVNSFDTDIMSPFRGMLKRRHRLRTTERFLIKRPRHEEEPACVTATLNF